jgi:competence protein ComEA
MDKEKRTKLILIFFIISTIFIALTVNFVNLVEANHSEISVEILGAIEKPGIYKLDNKVSIGELVKLAGGFKSDADQEFIKHKLNLSDLISKNNIYIPFVEETTKYISINNASKDELDSLTGIGSTTANKIIQSRPFTNLNELVQKKVLTQSVYDKIKDLITL